MVFLKRLGSPQDAADASQETFLRIVRRGDRKKGLSLELQYYNGNHSGHRGYVGILPNGASLCTLSIPDKTKC